MEGKKKKKNGGLGAGEESNPSSKSTSLPGSGYVSPVIQVSPTESPKSLYGKSDVAEPVIDPVRAVADSYEKIRNPNENEDTIGCKTSIRDSELSGKKAMGESNATNDKQEDSDMFRSATKATEETVFSFSGCVRTPSKDDNINLQEVFPALPNESMEEYMVRWSNRSNKPSTSKVKQVNNSNNPKHVSYVEAVQVKAQGSKQTSAVNFRYLQSEVVVVDGCDTCLPLNSVCET